MLLVTGRACEVRLIESCIETAVGTELLEELRKRCSGNTVAHFIFEGYVRSKVEDYILFEDDAEILGLLFGLYHYEDASLPPASGSEVPERIYGVTGFRSFERFKGAPIDGRVSGDELLKLVASRSLLCLAFDYISQDPLKRSWVQRLDGSEEE